MPKIKVVCRHGVKYSLLARGSQAEANRLKENARDYACATIRCYGDEDEIICDAHQEIVEDFRKAIEE